MIKKLLEANFFTTGLAMFAMFFGSGNLIFPVVVGQIAGKQNFYAMFGLFFTAVLMPFAALCLMLLYNGNYHHFFHKIGLFTGKFVAFITLALIGPFGVMPRCIAFSFSTLSIYTDSINIFIYSLLSCLLIYILSIKENSVVNIIGNFLTPILIVSLIIVIVKGLTADHIPLLHEQNLPILSMIKYGFLEGYKTFDIFAALFFSSAIIPSFRQVLGNSDCKKKLLALAVKSSLLGMFLLFAVYVGLSFVAANLRGGLVLVPQDKLLGVISTMTMGNTAGLFANLVVSLACLTTAISLAVVSAEFFKKEIFFNHLSYKTCLMITMIITLLFSLLGFNGIMAIILPILMVVCPAVIMLVLLNALNYFYGWKYIKIPVYLVFMVSLLASIL